jgi:ppGpp synthetase/RelA/SpoT-type nucleotidyltranferase
MVFSLSLWQVFPSTYKNVYQVMCTKQKVIDKSKGHRVLQNIGASGYNFVHVILPVLRIGGGY